MPNIFGIEELLGFLRQPNLHTRNDAWRSIIHADLQAYSP